MPPIPRSSQLHRPGSSPQGGNRCGRSEGSVPGRKKSMNPAYRPMLATLVDEPFDDKKWIFETKWDGFRLITEKRGHAVRRGRAMASTSLQGTRSSCQRFKRSRVRASSTASSAPLTRTGAHTSSSCRTLSTKKRGYCMSSSTRYLWVAMTSVKNHYLSARRS